MRDNRPPLNGECFFVFIHIEVLCVSHLLCKHVCPNLRGPKLPFGFRLCLVSLRLWLETACTTGYMIFHTSNSTGNCSLMQGVQGLSHFFGQRPKCQRCPFRLPSRKHVYCSLGRKTSKSCPQLIATEAKLLSCEYFAALEDCTAARGPGALRPGWGPGLTTRDPHKMDMKSLR